MIMGVTLTSQAADHIGKYLQKRGSGIGLRLGVRTTGCSGMAYKLEYVDEAAAEDQVFESFGEGFKFRNPNEKATCGCGESFTV
jgi:iron-sulfur cluster assembly protein